MQGFGEKGSPSAQRYEHPFIVVAYCVPVLGGNPSVDIVYRINRPDGRVRIRGAIFYEPDTGTCDDVVFQNCTLTVAEYITVNSKIAKVYDVIGTLNNPVNFPTQGLNGQAFESRDLADGVELRAHLVCPNKAGRFSITACLVPDQRLTMEEWHRLSTQFRIEPMSALRLGP